MQVAYLKTLNFYLLFSGNVIAISFISKVLIIVSKNCWTRKL